LEDNRIKKKNTAALCLQKPLFFKIVNIRPLEKKSFAAPNLPESLNQD